MKSFMLITIIISLLACAEIQDSSNKALDSAGSVVRSGKDKLWVNDGQNNKEDETQKAGN